MASCHCGAWDRLGGHQLAEDWRDLTWFCIEICSVLFFFQAEDGIRDDLVTGVQTCALPISALYRPRQNELDLFVADLGHVRERALEVFLHFVADGIELQAHLVETCGVRRAACAPARNRDARAGDRLDEFAPIHPASSRHQISCRFSA